MDIQTAAKYALHGYRIRRKSFPLIVRWAFSFREGPLTHNSIMVPCPSFSLDELMADDWEIVTEGIISDYGQIQYAPDPDEEDE